MTFTGTFYFQQPVMGQITGAVFIGMGRFHAEPPPTIFEKENLQRMLKADVVESDFEEAVLRFTDDTFAIIGQSHEPRGSAVKQAQDVASEFEARTVRETGVNVASRLLLSLLNTEKPGVFIAQFNKGRRGRFTYVLDPQCRIPTVNFAVNGGEKGLVFAYNAGLFSNDMWFASYSQEDYQRGRVGYSDAFDLVETPKYSMMVDLSEPRKAIKVSARAELVSLTDGVRAIPFALAEDLPEFDQLRKKKGMHITSAKLDGAPLETIQEEWEGGFLVILPAARKAKEQFFLEMEVEVISSTTAQKRLTATTLSSTASGIPGMDTSRAQSSTSPFATPRNTRWLGPAFASKRKRRRTMGTRCSQHTAWSNPSHWSRSPWDLSRCTRTSASGPTR